MAEEKHSKIEDIKDNLYDRKDTTSGRHFKGILHKVKYKAPQEWQKDEDLNSSLEEMKKPKTSIFKKRGTSQRHQIFKQIFNKKRLKVVSLFNISRH